MASKSNIENLILRLFERREIVSKDDVVPVARCTPQSAQRVLNRMHKENRVRVCKWLKHGARNIPVYKLGPGRNKPPPAPLTSAQRSAIAYSKYKEVRISKQRIKRMAKRIKEKKFGYKTNPYGVFYRIADQHSDRVCD